jgi:trigger factor
MQIEVKEIEPCKLLINYQADAEQILNKRAEVIQAFKKAPVPGFRPGKASAEALNYHYKDQINESLKKALAEDAYHNVLFEKKIRPHGAPRFSSLFLGDGRFNCEFEVYTKPEFELAPYTGLEVPKPHDSLTVPEATEKMLQELRVRFGESTPYMENDFIQEGDSVILDYEGSVDGEKVEALCAQGEMLTVGASKLRDFDNNLLGMTLNEVREFNLTVPEGGLPSLAGKTVHFSVTLIMGSKNVPCALDDSLAIKIGKKDYQELREFTTASAAAQIANGQKQALNNAISAKLVDDNNFEVPDWLKVSEAKYLAHNAKLNWDTMSDLDKESYLTMANKNVKLSLVLDRIRETEPEAQLTDQEVFDMIKRNLANTKLKVSLDEVIKEMNRTGYLQILFSRIRDEYTLDFVVKSAKVIE